MLLFAKSSYNHDETFNKICWTSFPSQLVWSLAVASRVFVAPLVIWDFQVWLGKTGKRQPPANALDADSQQRLKSLRDKAHPKKQVQVI